MTARTTATVLAIVATVINLTAAVLTFMSASTQVVLVLFAFGLVELVGAIWFAREATR